MAKRLSYPNQTYMLPCTDDHVRRLGCWENSSSSIQCAASAGMRTLVDATAAPVVPKIPGRWHFVPGTIDLGIVRPIGTTRFAPLAENTRAETMRQQRPGRTRWR